MKRSINFSSIFQHKEEDPALLPIDQTDRAALARPVLGRLIKLSGIAGAAAQVIANSLGTSLSNRGLA